MNRRFLRGTAADPGTRKWPALMAVTESSPGRNPSPVHGCRIDSRLPFAVIPPKRATHDLTFARCAHEHDSQGRDRRVGGRSGRRQADGPGSSQRSKNRRGLFPVRRSPEQIPGSHQESIALPQRKLKRPIRRPSPWHPRHRPENSSATYRLLK